MARKGTDNNEFRAQDPTIVWLPGKLGEGALRMRLASHAPVRRLHVRDARAAWTDWEQAGAASAFDMRFTSALAPWATTLEEEDDADEPTLR